VGCNTRNVTSIRGSGEFEIGEDCVQAPKSWMHTHTADASFSKKLYQGLKVAGKFTRDVTSMILKTNDISTARSYVSAEWSSRIEVSGLPKTYRVDRGTRETFGFWL